MNIGKGDCVAYIYGQNGRYEALDYPQLAKLYRDVKSGVPEALVEWERQPEGEKRLAAQIVKAYSGPAKPKKTRLTKAQKTALKSRKPKVTEEMRMQARIIDNYVNSADPATREAAKKTFRMG